MEASTAALEGLLKRFLPGDASWNSSEKGHARLLKQVLINLSGNRLMQRGLERTVSVSQYLMGIGSGSSVQLSGEQAIFAILRQTFSPPYCIFDVGANQGQFLGMALRHVAAHGLVIHCFEPGCETFKILRESARGDDRVKLSNIALGRECGEGILHFDRAGSGLASLTPRRLEHFDIDFSQSETVGIGTVDTYCAANSVSRINLLKMDIEGHELDALHGARRMFDAKSIDMVSFEFGGCNIDTRTFFRDFWYFFQEVKMKIRRITPSGYLHPVESYKEIYEQFRTTNFVAILS
jgi:FkbM family methyltransferase